MAKNEPNMPDDVKAAPDKKEQEAPAKKTGRGGGRGGRPPKTDKAEKSPKAEKTATAPKSAGKQASAKAETPPPEPEKPPEPMEAPLWRTGTDCIYQSFRTSPI